MQPGADSPDMRSACAKIILCGEHAVVYGRPAIALPLPALRTRAWLTRRHDHFEIRATDINHVVVMPRIPPPQLRKPHPLALIAWHTFQYLRVRPPRAVLTIASDIPVGSNLGSGAAVSIALARALGAFFHHELTPAEASALAYEVEKQHHGTPSGIDNTVIAYEQPVWFVRGDAESGAASLTPAPLLAAPEPFSAPPLTLVIGDSGQSTPTRVSVAAVRALREAQPARVERVMDAIGTLVTDARAALDRGDLPALGALMDTNHALLRQLTVSSDKLDALCAAARAAGALGAKMSGGGRGGNMLALARDAGHAAAISAALTQAGARRVFCA